MTDPKQDVVGAPKRPKPRSADIGCISDDHRTNASVYIAKDADAHFEKLEAIIAQKDAEIAALRSSSAQVRSDALREAAFIVQASRCESLTRKDEGRIIKAILSLNPTEAERKQP